MVGEKLYEELGEFLLGKKIPVLTVPAYFPLEETSDAIEWYGSEQR